ncbi:MAG: hypothetical protein ABR575_06300 [Actinomycetota bacterium]
MSSIGSLTTDELGGRVHRSSVFGLVAVLLLSSGPGGGGAGAAAKKPRAVVTTLYAHGAYPVGEVEMSADTVAALTGGEVHYRTMDPNEPSGGAPKSVLFFSDPAPINCAGNWFAPTWQGAVTGRIKGPMTFTFHTLGQGGTVKLRFYNDVPDSCSVWDPFATLDVEVPSGQATVEAVLPKANVAATTSLMVSIFPETSPMYSRILYDSTSAPTGLTFTCVPPRGAKTCTPT